MCRQHCQRGILEYSKKKFWLTGHYDTAQFFKFSFKQAEKLKSREMKNEG